MQSQQTTIEIKGTIIEESSKERIEGATVRLLNFKDSTMINGVSSSGDGNFSITKVSPSNYLLYISYIGFEPFYQPLGITGEVNPVELGEILISESTISLSDAIITAHVPPMVVRNDTIEYNADSYKVTEGAILEDLLRRLPGVEVQRNGTIKVNGKEISRILVDGKEFFSSDPKIASQNLPADIIDKVQTYEKKSDNAELTGFQDGQEENVINITIKPEKKKGWFGNTSGGYGTHNRYEGNAMVNRFIDNDQLTITGNLNNTNNRGDEGGGFGRGGGSGSSRAGNIGANFNKEFHSKLSLNGDVSYNGSDNTSRTSARMENILSADSSLFENQTGGYNSIYKSVGTNFNMEWKPDTLTSIYFRPGFNYTRSENGNERIVHSHDKEGKAVYSSQENYFMQGDGYNIDGSLYISRRLNNKGRMLNISLNSRYNDNTNEGTNKSRTDYFQRQEEIDLEEIDQQVSDKNKGTNYNTYINWVEPLGKDYYLQASYNFRHSKEKSLKNAYSKDAEMNYSILDSAYSQSYENRFIDQSFNINFRSQKEKYDYQIGLSIDPSYNSSRTFVADTTLSRISRTTVNFSPSFYMGYKWGDNTNLRINYSGYTSQPHISQLKPVREISSSTHVIMGNPNLKTSYMNYFGINFHRYKPESQQVLMIMLHGGYTFNAITSKTLYDEDGSGNRTTTYENVNGNYNGNLRVAFNSPLRNRKFTYNTMSSIGYNNYIGFVNEKKSSTSGMSIQEQIGFNYRSDKADIGIQGNMQYSNSKNSLQKENNRTIWNYNAGGYMTLYLPLDFKLETDIMYSGNAGYSDNFKQKEILWNASASKAFMKKKQATVRFKIYDILNKQSNISRHETATYIQEFEYDSLNSYCMFYFIYRFQLFN